VNLYPRAVRVFKEKRGEEETSVVGSVMQVTPDALATAPSLCATYIFGKANTVVSTEDHGPGADGMHRCGSQTSGAQTRSSNSKGPDAGWRLRDNS
jgi:hypothetical protein